MKEIDLNDTHRTDAADVVAFARVAEWAAADPFLRMLGVKCVDGGLGWLTLTMTVGPDHLNYQGACHGGVLFSLADAAFGLAGNSYGASGVGIDTHMTFQRAARLGDVLVARSRELSRARKVAFYQVEIGTEREPLLASFTGTIYLKTEKTP